jgi:hypothetical protein
VFLKVIRILLITLGMTIGVAHGQQAVSSITQSRLFTNPSTPGTTSVDANADASGGSSPMSSGDDSFGAQIILKNQERPRSFSIGGDVSSFYTNNVDLTPRVTRSDSFLAANVGAAWRPILSRALTADLSVGGSVFRYDKASELDFERISAGTGLNWLVPRMGGIIGFGHYDFTQVWNRDSVQLLQDHEFTVGAQKTFILGRSNFLTTGVAGVLGISDPRSQERDQAAIHAAYHLQIARSFDTDLVYRYAAQFYARGERVDHNETLSLSIGYYPTRWMRLGGLISGARNDSNRGRFSYEVLNLGGAVGCTIRF